MRPLAIDMRNASEFADVEIGYPLVTYNGKIISKEPRLKHSSSKGDMARAERMKTTTNW